MPRLLHYSIALIVSSILLSANAAAVNSQHPASQQPAIFAPRYNTPETGIPIAPFTSIYASGNVNIIVNPPTKNQFAYYAAPQTHLQLHGRTLFIADSKRGPAQTVTLWADHLTGIYLSGNANLTAAQFTTRELYLSLTDNSSLRLRGKIGLKQLLDSSNGMVDIQWVDARQLLLQSTANGSIRLAGVAYLLDAKVFARGILAAKYLRAQNVFAQAGQGALIEVLALNSLSAFASDYSNIYYYKTPKRLTRDSRDAGNVLQMDYWR